MITRKTDNHNLRAKLELRREMLRRSGIQDFSVCDCFSGSETIWSTLRREFPVRSYLALDVKEKRGRLKIDSLRYLQNQQWTHDVIDLDSYGSPWRHYFEVTKRGRDCLVFLTTGARTAFHNHQKEALEYLGINFWIPQGIVMQLDELVLGNCLSYPLAHGLRIEHALEAENPGGNARYFGVSLKSTSVPKCPKAS